jgi:hypothetical protein
MACFRILAKTDGLAPGRLYRPPPGRGPISGVVPMLHPYAFGLRPRHGHEPARRCPWAARRLSRTDAGARRSNVPELALHRVKARAGGKAPRLAMLVGDVAPDKALPEMLDPQFTQSVSGAG